MHFDHEPKSLVVGLAGSYELIFHENVLNQHHTLRVGAFAIPFKLYIPNVVFNNAFVNI